MLIITFRTELSRPWQPRTNYSHLIIQLRGSDCSLKFTYKARLNLPDNINCTMYVILCCFHVFSVYCMPFSKSDSHLPSACDFTVWCNFVASQNLFKISSIYIFLYNDNLHKISTSCKTQIFLERGGGLHASQQCLEEFQLICFLRKILLT